MTYQPIAGTFDVEVTNYDAPGFPMKEVPVTVKVHSPGCYRVHMAKDRFGQVFRKGREWHAEIRSRLTGNILRFAGIWKARHEAIGEIASILDREGLDP